MAPRWGKGRSAKSLPFATTLGPKSPDPAINLGPAYSLTCRLLRRLYGPFTSVVQKIALTARWLLAQKLRPRTHGQAAVHRF
jgi:hypothetical protein